MSDLPRNFGPGRAAMKVDKGPEERGEDWIAVANGSMVAELNGRARR